MNVLTQIKNIANAGGTAIAAICPGCNREGNLAPMGQDISFTVPDVRKSNTVRQIIVGSRLCPNPKCMTHVFVVWEPPGELIHSYPTGRIDFDATDVPKKVRNAFDETITSTANECYVGAGMLIRKTLEAVCEDRSASGNNLKERIADLRNKVTLPTALFEAMDHLRLLGNDAAHIEAKSYDEVGKAEVMAGIELSKEIIKATYQHKSLLEKLLALKK